MTGQLRIDVDGLLVLCETVTHQVEIESGPEVYHRGRREASIRDCDGYSLILSEVTTDPARCTDV